MGKLISGINGPVIGKVGAVVGYVSNGQAIIRGLSTRPKKPPTVPQLQQHAKFSVMNGFLTHLIPFLNIANKSAIAHVSGYNKAFSYNVKNAITGTYPDLAIDFNMVLLTRGDLQNIKNLVVKPLTGGILHFTWTNNSGIGKAAPQDNAFVAVFCQPLSTWEYGFDLGVRSAETCNFKTSNFSGYPVQIYIGFLSADGNEVSDSLFADSVQIS